jgi:PAS domain-containing protein
MSEDLRSAEDARMARLALDAVGQALIAADMAGTVTFWNAAAERL